MLGINGMGRIGKLLLWNFIGNKSFDEIVINSGREIGTSIYDIVSYLKKDSSYGTLNNFLFGFKGYKKQNLFKKIDNDAGTLEVNNVKLHFLRENRNPKDINWGKYGVTLGVDTTGQFLDPNAPLDSSKGSLRGHFHKGVKKLIVSAPFKLGKDNKMPNDVVTTVMGINENDYDKKKHNVISNASCTTTCLAHMLKPITDEFGIDKFLSINMITIHAATPSQNIIDSVPKTSAKDLRKNRSFDNNIILTSTGAAKALSLVMPEIKNVNFTTKSVRVPSVSGSMIILNISLKGDFNEKSINKAYQKIAQKDKNNYLVFSEEQNVSSDIVGSNNAAIIEGKETETTFYKKDNITNATIYGWYDNEMGYASMLARRVVSIA